MTLHQTLRAPSLASCERSVLLLQGPPTPFWRELGQAFAGAGHPVRHLGFCLGDRLLWAGAGTATFRGPLAAWGERLEAEIRAGGVTDLLYYADRVPYHRAAIEVARRLGVRAWAVENGYLRPDWITLEAEGMGAYSRFPREPCAIEALAVGRPLPDPTPRYRHGFVREAMAEVAYNLALSAGRPFFPRYASEKWLPPPVDYASWPRKWLVNIAARRAARDSIPAPYALLALQLASDYQIRASSAYHRLEDMLADVLESFAAHAPAVLKLVVKVHPLDNGWHGWPRILRRLAEQRGIGGRVQVIDGGDLGGLLAAAHGLVTVNSTVGLTALRAGVPVIALGDAVYDLPGLCHRGGLDRFWTAPQPVDVEFAEIFVRALTRIQVRGSFYDPAGRRAAVAEIVRRIERPDDHWILARPLAALGPGPRRR